MLADELGVDGSVYEYLCLLSPTANSSGQDNTYVILSKFRADVRASGPKQGGRGGGCSYEGQSLSKGEGDSCEGGSLSKEEGE